MDVLEALGCFLKTDVCSCQPCGAFAHSEALADLHGVVACRLVSSGQNQHLA